MGVSAIISLEGYADGRGWRLKILASFCRQSSLNFSIYMSDVEQDQILDQFIQRARSDQSLRDEIKSALNQDEVIAIAQRWGFSIDSMAILRKWSKHTDFSKPTWLGWFDE